MGGSVTTSHAGRYTPSVLSFTHSSVHIQTYVSLVNIVKNLARQDEAQTLTSAELPFLSSNGGRNDSILKSNEKLCRDVRAAYSPW